MRIATLAMAALPLVFAHTSPLERKARHAQIERQLLTPIEEDPESSSSAFAAVTPPVRSSSTTVAVASSAVRTTSRAVVSSSVPGSILPTSLIGAIVGNGQSSVSSVSSISGTGSSGSLSASASSSASASASDSSSSIASSSATSSASASSASVSQMLSTSMDEGGRVVIVTAYYTPSAMSTLSSPAGASSSPAPTSEGPSLPVGAIIGISVAVGVVILSLIGCAVWRMKRRAGDEDEAIRWPELNRHGDSDAHHALPARATGKHGIETDALERTMSNSSEVYMSQAAHARPPSMPMALNGSSFGAASALDYNYAEKDLSPNPSPPVSHAHTTEFDYGYPSYHPSDQPQQNTHDAYDVDDYANLPPPLATQPMQTTQGVYESDSEGDHGVKAVVGGAPPMYR